MTTNKPDDAAQAPDFVIGRMLSTLPASDPIAVLAVRAARAGVGKADELRDRDWLGPYIDDVPSPFEGDVGAAFTLLEHGEDAAPFLSTAPYQPHHVGDDAINADQICFTTMQRVAERAWPGVIVAGEEDGRDVSVRAQLLRETIDELRPWLVTDPIDGTLAYRRMRTDDYWASVAVAGVGSTEFAVCVASSDIVALAVNEQWAAVWQSGAWRLCEPPVDHESRDAFSAIIPTIKRKYRVRYRETLEDQRIELICGFSGNPAILRGVLLGLVDAAVQPSCYAWDNAIAYIAACAGLSVMRLDKDTFLDAAEVRELMVRTLTTGEKLPDMIVGRNNPAIHRLLSIVVPREMPPPSHLNK